MRPIVLVLVLLAACSGCVTVTSGPPPVKAGALAVPPEIELKPGMTVAEVFAIMDRAVTVGYDVDVKTGVARPIEARSLFSTEILTAGNRTCQVDKYIVRTDSGIAVTAEDLLFPVVFERGLLIAKGREGLEALLNK